MEWIAAVAVAAVGTGVLVWIAIGRVMEKIDQLPDNTPEAFRRAGDSPADGGESRVRQRVVVCVGDSITQGSISSNYVDILASRFSAGEFRFVNAGINGDLAFNVTQRLDEVIECKPNIVTVLIGTNDANALTHRSNLKRYIRDKDLPQTPTEEWYRENLARIVSRLQNESDASIVVLSIPPIGEEPDHPAFVRSQMYGEIARDVAHAAGVDYLPLGEAMVAHLDLDAGNPKRNSHPLTAHKQSSHKLSAVVGLVLRRFVLNQAYAAISRSNGHILLTDHLHLNDTGAEVVADTIEGYLRNTGGPR